MRPIRPTPSRGGPRWSSPFEPSGTSLPHDPRRCQRSRQDISPSQAAKSRACTLQAKRGGRDRTTSTRISAVRTNTVVVLHARGTTLHACRPRTPRLGPPFLPGVVDPTRRVKPRCETPYLRAWRRASMAARRRSSLSGAIDEHRRPWRPGRPACWDRGDFPATLPGTCRGERSGAHLCDVAGSRPRPGAALGVPAPRPVQWAPRSPKERARMTGTGSGAAVGGQSCSDLPHGASALGPCGCRRGGQ